MSPSSTPAQPNAPIAIIGLACRFPGAPTPAAYWRLLRDGLDAVRETPPDRWALPAFYSPDGNAPASIVTRWGGFLDQIDAFDAQFFGVSPREAAHMDPQQRLLLEVAWEALEDAGLPPSTVAGTPVGVFVGVSNHDYADIQLGPHDRLAISAHTNTGAALSIAANRISYLLDLRGPSFAVDTACSSALTALHLACHSLWRGESTLALAGGVNLLLRPEPTIGFSKAQMLSPDGRCRSFDARANGYARGEGAGLVVLKPLAAAQADGDPIYAVILGSAINQDGQTNGMTVPSVTAQQRMLTDAYLSAGIDPASVSYVEAHGTGTPVGDPLEAAALGGVLGQARPAATPLAIGSVKSQIGHLESAAGIAGLIKVALALHHNWLPASLHYLSPNPRIDFAHLNLRVHDRSGPWPRPTGRAIAGVSAFGFGGANAHLVVAEAPPLPPPTPRAPAPTLITLSARTPAALHERAHALRTHFTPAESPQGEPAAPLNDASASTLPDLAYTLAARREHHAHRLAFVATTAAEAHTKLDAFVTDIAFEHARGTADSASPGPLTFVYTGMGPQWHAMGRDLLTHAPAFRAAVEQCDHLLTPLAGWSVLAELQRPEAETRMAETAIAQPANFVLQVALTHLLATWGITPDALVGHSAGEVAAGYVAGAYDLATAVRIIYHRSHQQQRAHGQGALAAFGLPVEHAQKALRDSRFPDIEIAAINAPDGVTLVGARADLEAFLAPYEAQGIFCRFLQVGVPFHSRFMDPLEADLRAALTDLPVSMPTRPLYSTVTGAHADAPWDATYWWRNVRAPVQFAPACARLLADGYRHFIEIGPHPALLHSLQACAQHAHIRIHAHPTLRRQSDDRERLLTTLGALYTLGYTPNWRALVPDARPHALPPYPWQRTRHWRESSASRTARLAVPAHPLLGTRQPLPEPTWTHTLDLVRHAWLADHAVEGHPVFPAAAYLETALAAAHAHYGAPDGAVALTQVNLPKALFLAPKTAYSTRFTLAPESGAFSFHAQSTADDEAWTLHAHGRLAVEPHAIQRCLDLATLQADCTQPLNPERFYALMHQIGLHYGPAFQGVQAAWLGRTHGAPAALGQLALPDGLCTDEYHLHPALLDAAFQVTLALIPPDRRALFLPVRIGRLRLYARPDPSATLWCHATLRHLSAHHMHADLTLLDATGRVLAELRDFTAQALDTTRADLAHLTDWLYPTTWERTARPDRAPHTWLPANTAVQHALAEVESQRVTRPNAPSLPQHGAGIIPQVNQPARDVEGAGGRPSAETTPPVNQPARDVEGAGGRPSAETTPPVNQPARDVEGAGRRPAHALPHVAAQLNRLSRAYIAHALATLMRTSTLPEPWTPGTHWDATTLLAHVHPRHTRLVRHLTDQLARHGWLTPTSAGWRVVRTPDDADPQSVQVELQASLDSPDLALAARVGPQVADAWRGIVDPLTLIFPAGEHDDVSAFYGRGLLFAPYNALARAALTHVLADLPDDHVLRVLEIGAGSGGLTAAVLPELPIERTAYHFTDVSPHFTRAAQARFAHYPNFTTGLFDLTRDASAQGLTPGTYDIVLASNVFHATPDLRTSLAHARDLLAPGGLLVLLELTDPWLIADLVFGLTEGWWAFTDTDLRPAHPLMPHARWETLLRDCGFTDVVGLVPPGQGLPRSSAPRCIGRIGDAPTDANAEPAQTLFLARAPLASPPPARHWLVLAEPADPLSLELLAALRAHGHTCTIAHAADTFAENDAFVTLRPHDPTDFQSIVDNSPAEIGDVLYLWGTSATATTDVPHAALTAASALLHLAQALALAPQLDAPRLTLVTRGLHPTPDSTCAAPHQATLLGLMRVINNELPQLHTRLLDLPAAPMPLADEVRQVLAELHHPDDREAEVALRPTGRWAPRLQPYADLRQPAGDFRVESLFPGLDGLILRAAPTEAPGPGEVALAVHAAGLNFKEVLKALGMLSAEMLAGGFSEHWLGMECAGVVTAVGDGVTSVHVGDAVVALAARALGTHVHARAELVAPKPPALSFAQAAALPVAYLTVVYALEHLARLQAGERVLIHAATGGVGLAALQVAQHIGAEIFATAGSAEKQAVLRDAGVAHIMSSRTLAFADEILNLTDGQGVDVVLNALAGEALQQSLAVLAPYGRFIELGKMDIFQHKTISLRPFGDNRAFMGVDIDQLANDRPAWAGALFQRIIARVASGEYAPLPIHAFPITAVTDAFELLARAQHIGKVVLTFDTRPANVHPPRMTQPAFRADATYLITGGLGGFGLQIARWLILHGARRIVLASRRAAPDADAATQIAALRATGAEIIHVAADISHADAVRALIAQCNPADAPLRGVFHTAMVLSDGLLLSLDRDAFARVFAPKVDGAWWLHEYTRDLPLDHFALFSSIAATWGAQGQGNYAAANAFLDALAHYRHGLGLPALSVNWGVLGEVGYVARHTAVHTHLANHGLTAIAPEQATALLGLLLSGADSLPTLMAAHINWAQWRGYVPAAAKTTRFTRVLPSTQSTTTDATDTPSETLADTLHHLPPAERLAVLNERLRRHISRVLNLPAEQISTDGTLAALGMDSLLAVEIKHAIEHDVRTELPLTSLLGGASLSTLSAYLLHALERAN